MDNTRVVEVSAFDKLCDEEAENSVYNISSRSFLPCLFHRWTNANLSWRHDGKEHSQFVDICGEEVKDDKGNVVRYSWGKGYGGIRFCRRCKTISCVHLFKEHTEYKMIKNPYYHRSYLVSKCDRCGLRVGRGTAGVCKPSKEAVDLITEVAKEFSVDYGLGPTKTRLGSGFYCELPVQVSNIMICSDPMGTEQAKDWVRLAFKNGVSM